MKRKKNTKRSVDTLNIDNLIYFIILISCMIIPVMVRIKSLDYVSPTIDYSDNYNTGLKGDFFDYNRLFLLKILVIILCLLFFYKLLLKKYIILCDGESLLMLMVFVLIIISCVCSQFYTIALNGILEHFEGTSAFLIYIIFAFIAANIKVQEKYLEYFYYVLGFVILVNCITSITNFFGYDLFQTYIVKRVITPFEFDVSIIGHESFIITTLGNKNYLSGLSSALTCLFTIKYFFSKENKSLLIYFFLTIISFTSMLLSLSTSGFFALLSAFPIIVFLLFRNKNIEKILIKSCSLLILFFLIFVLLNIFNSSVWNETIGFFEGLMNKSENTIINENTLLDEKISKIDMVEKEFNLPAKNISAGNGRLYLWKETIKLIKNRPILGHGLDTLYYYFPNNDVSMYNNIGSYQAVTTKPHSFYLSFAFGVGIPALILMLLLFAKHGYNLLKIIVSSKQSWKVENLSAFGIAFWTFLIQWLINDSVIGVSLIFWIMFGLSLSLVNSEKNNTPLSK